MTKATILITGSTGKTGFIAAKTLLENGHPVKAMVRQQSIESDNLKALGAEIVYASFHDLTSLEKSLEGVDRAYFVYPPEDHLLEATANFIVAAKQNNVKAIVNMSQLPARKNHSSHLTRQHWLAEQMLNQTEISITHVCPGFFSEMLYLMNGANILQEGKIYLPHGEAYHAPIAAEDIGRCVAAILEEPHRHEGKRYVLTGAERLSHDDIASIAADVLGKPVQYIALPFEDWSDAMKRTGYLSDFLISHLVEVGKDYKKGVFDQLTTAVEDLTGRKPMAMKTFIENNKAYFTPEYLQALAAKLTAQMQST
ncbi:MAG: NmrA family NAD(P)-binding protein [Amphritea sp.]